MNNSSGIHKHKLFLMLMAFCLFVVFLLANPSSSSATTNVAATTLTTDTIWSISGSPYYVTGTVTVNSGVKLTVNPGVIVKFASSCITVNGTLDARGTQTNPIKFTDYRDDAIVGDTNGDGSATSPVTGGINHISFGSTGSATLEYCTIRYGYNGLYKTGSGSLTMTNCSVTNNIMDGIRLYSSTGSATISNCVVSSNGEAGMYLNGSSGTLQGNTFTGSPHGIYMFNSSTVLQDNTSTGNQYGVYMGPSDSIVGSGNIFAGNSVIGVAIGQGTITKNTTWSLSGSPYYIAGSVEVPKGYTLTIEPGVVVKFAGSYLSVLGNLNAQGNEASPIFFTDYRDDTVGGDTNGDGNASLPAASSWNGISMQYEGSANIKCCTVRYANRGIYKVGSGTLTMDNCTLTKGYDGLYLYNSSSTNTGTNYISNSVISGNSHYGAYLGPDDALGGTGNTLTGNTINAIAIAAGYLKSPKTWSLSECPYYYLTGTVTLNSTLTIEPGVVVKFANSAYLTVNIALNAQGTEISPIYFTDYRDDTIGGDTNGDGPVTSPIRGSWNGINTGSAGTVTMEYCTVMYGKDGVYKTGSGGLTMGNCTLTAGSEAGLYLDNSTGTDTISSSIMSNNTKYGIYISGSSPVLQGNTITGNQYGLYMSPNDGFSGSGNSFTGNTINTAIGGGNITKNTSLRFAASPYCITGVVAVNPGITLTIEPGVVIKFAVGSSSVGIDVNGTLDAQGTEAKPIYLTDYRDDNIAGDTNGDGAATSPALAWTGIKVQFAGSATMKHCVVSYANYGVYMSGSGSLNVENCTFNKDYNGVYFSNSAGLSTISNCVMSNSTQYGICIGGSNPVLTTNTSTSNQYGLSIASCTPVLNGNNITGNKYGLYIGAGDEFSGGSNIFTGNTVNAVLIGGGTITKNKTWNLADSQYYILGDITVNPGATLTIEPGVVVKFADEYSLCIDGALNAQGTATNPIYFTSYRDDTVGGDTNLDGSSSIPYEASWGAIVIRSSAATMKYCTSRYAEYGVYKRGSGNLTMDSCTLTNNSWAGICLSDSTGTDTISNCVMTNNYSAGGIYLSGSNPTIIKNKVYSNTVGIYCESNANPTIGGTAPNANQIYQNTQYGIQNTSTNTVNARYNWWGDSSGPYHAASNLSGKGNSVSNYVDYSNYLQIAPVTINSLNSDKASPQPANSIITWTCITSGGTTLQYQYRVRLKDGEWVLGKAYSTINTWTWNPADTGTYEIEVWVKEVGSSTEYDKNKVVEYTISPTSSAGTTIGASTITTNTTWRLSGSPYYITGIVTINPGAILTIDPGVIVKFSGSSYLDVEGTLNAQGTETSLIYFTDYRDDTVGGDSNGDEAASSPSAGSWGGVNISSAGTATMEFCTIRYGYHGVCQTGSGSLTIDHCTLTEGSNDGLYLYNSTGINTVNDCVMSNNAKYGIYMGPMDSFDGSGNTCTGNSINATVIRAGQITRNITWNQLYSPYYIEGTVLVESGATLTIEPGVAAKFAYGQNFTIYGVLNAQGTEISPIYFTDRRDDTVGGDTNGDGTTSVPVIGEWGGIDISDQGTAVFKYCTVKYAYNGIEKSGSGSLTMDSCTVTKNNNGIYLGNTSDTDTISSSIINNNYDVGIYLYNCNPNITKNKIYSNHTGIECNENASPIIGGSAANANRINNNGSGVVNYYTTKYITVNAQYNWWGDTSGPYHSESNPAGTGDTVGNYVDYSHYLTTEPGAIKSFSSDKASSQAVNTTLTWTCNVSEGVSVEYQYRVRLKGGEWTTAQAYSSTNTWAWTPAAPGTYEIEVWVREVGSTNEYDQNQVAEYTIVPAPVVINSLIPDKDSPRPAGTSIVWTCNASGGSSLSYQYYVRTVGGSWKSQGAYSATNTFTWKPTIAGNYQITTWVKDAGSTASYDQKLIVDYTVVAPVAITSFTPNKTSPQAFNTSITWTCTASGGSSLIYQYYVRTVGGSWKSQGAYSSSNTFLWKPTAVGDYEIAVWVKDSGSTANYDKKLIVPYTIAETGPLSLNSFTPSKASPQPANTSIIWTCDASGGTSPSYQFWVRPVGGSWKSAGVYSATNTFTWKPTVLGNYEIAAWVKNAGSTANYDQKLIVGYTITEAIGVVTINSFEPDKASPQAVNTTIIWTCTASGGTSLNYQFYTRPTGGSWKSVGAYSATNTFTWKPTTVGSYQVAAWVKDSSSSKSYDQKLIKDYTVTAPGPVTIETFVSDLNSPQSANTTITWTCTASGGTSLKYQFWTKPVGGTWKSVGAYSANNKFVWTPVTAGDYQIAAWVKDVNSTGGNYDQKLIVDYTITEAAALMILDPNSSIEETNPETPTEPEPADQTGNDGGINDANTNPEPPTDPVIVDSNSGSQSGGEAITETPSALPAVLESYIADLASPQTVGITINWICTATGGTNLSYEFAVKSEAEDWQVVQPYSTSNTFSWTPAAVGNYQIRVWLKDAVSTNECDQSAIMDYAISDRMDSD